MLRVKNQEIKFKHTYCQQCGTCLSVCPNDAVTSSLTSDGTSIIHINKDFCNLCKLCVKYCPANKLFKKNDLHEYAKQKKYYLGYTSNENIRRQASSGGVARTIIIEGLKKNLFDGAYTLKKTSVYPYTEGYYFDRENIPHYDDIPNSIYHSVLTNQNLRKIKTVHKLLVIGTTCQLKDIEKLLKGKYEKIIKIAIFCKQQKTFESTNFIAKMVGEDICIDKPFYQSYSGGGWPGKATINKKQISFSIAAQLPFGRRLWSVRGCDICGNPFGDNVDITLLDPWGIDEENNLGRNLIIVHSSQGKEILDNLENYLCIEQKALNEILPALMLKDIERKQMLIPFFLGKKVSTRIILAGKFEKLQRIILIYFAKKLPRLPIMVYRTLNKLPDLRNIILR